MRRCKETAEVVVRFDYKTERAHICVAEWPAQADRFKRLFGPPGRKSPEDRSWFWDLPLQNVRVNRRTARVMSEVERKAAADRFRLARERRVAD